MNISDYMKFSYRKRQFLNERKQNLLNIHNQNGNNLLHYIKYFNTCSYDNRQLTSAFATINNSHNVYFAINCSVHFNDICIHASCYKNLCITKYLVKNNINTNTIRAMINMAAVSKHLSIIKTLIKFAPSDFITLVCQNAASDGNLSVVKFSVRNGADLSAFDNSALEAMAENGDFHIIKYLKRRKN